MKNRIIPAIIITASIAFVSALLVQKRKSSLDSNKIDLIAGAGWEQSKKNIEEKFSGNDELKMAALQLGEAFQKAIDNPTQESIYNEIVDGMSCIYGVQVSQGIPRLKAVDAWDDIRDTVIQTADQQKKYIHFNGKMSGAVLKSASADRSKCKQANEKKK